MAKNYEYEHTHIEIKHGYAIFLGKDLKPSDELLNALNKMSGLAYNECGGLKVNTGGGQLTIPDVSKSVCPKCGSTNWLYDNLLNMLSCENCYTKF